MHRSPPTRHPAGPRAAGSALVVAASLVAAGLTVAAPAQAASSSVVISEVYGGGSNASAAFTHDFVELYNLSSTSVTLDGWQVRYGAAGSPTTSSSTTLTGSIAPGGSYLVQLAGGTVGQPLPAPDATGTTAMGATAGRVDLVAADPRIGLVDRVGYGSSAAAVTSSL